MPFFSIIMPIYNVEKYIMNSVKSVCNQTFKDFELILVNDGSPDRSIENATQILKETKIDYFIINQENKGVSVARNEGIKSAKGEWVICLDPDDMLHSRTLELVHNIIKKEKTIDSVFLKYKTVEVNEEINLNYNVSEKYSLFDRETVSEKFLYRKTKLIAPGAIVRRALIIDKELYYDEEVIYSEDQLYVWRLIGSAQRMAVMEGDTYNYLIRANSTMRDSQEKKILSGYNAFSKLQENVLLNKGLYGNCGEYILPRWVFGVLHATAKYMEYNKFLQLAKQMNFKAHFKKLSSCKDFKVKLLVLINSVNPYLFWITAKFL